MFLLGVSGRGLHLLVPSGVRFFSLEVPQLSPSNSHRDTGQVCLTIVGPLEGVRVGASGDLSCSSGPAWAWLAKVHSGHGNPCLQAALGKHWLSKGALFPVGAFCFAGPFRPGEEKEDREKGGGGGAAWEKRELLLLLTPFALAPKRISWRPLFSDLLLENEGKNEQNEQKSGLSLQATGCLCC